MGRKSSHNLPPGIQLDQHGVYWATLEGADAKDWRERYPGRSLPRRKADDLKAALKLQRLLIDDMRTGRDPNAENPTVMVCVETWIDGKQKLADSTSRHYRQSLGWQIEPHRIGRLRIRQVTYEHVEAWIRDLKLQTRQGDDEHTLDAYSIRNAFAVLRAALNTAVQRGRIAKNPCDGVELPQPDDEEIQPLTPEQADILLTMLDTYELDRATGAQRPHRLAALYHIAIRCGLRKGEILGLRWKDIDLKRREIRVAGQMQSGERTSRAKTPRSRRAHPLTTDAVNALRWHKQNQIEERNMSGAGWNPGDLVFCSTEGTPISQSNLTRQFDALLKRAKLPDIRFHDLRHTYAALSIAAGVDLYTLSRRMGHSSITVTADRYGHLYQGSNQDADALDRLIKRA
jgi:integrase